MKQLKILLVEDDHRLGEQLLASIVEYGWICRWAKDGISALEAERFYQPELILLDLKLPDHTGFDVLSHIRRISAVPVVVISAQLQAEDKVRALNMGADDYVTKPFWVDELIARIRAVIRRFQPAQKEAASIYQIGELHINLETHEVKIGDHPCDLTPTEFGILSYFIKKSNQALAKERILDALGKEEETTLESIQTHVSRLRKKIKTEGNRIQTVWGIGYKFVSH